MPYRSPYPDVQIPEVSLTNFILGEAHQLDKPALIEGLTGRFVTYGQLAEGIKSCARRLAALGVRQGDVVALYGPDSPEFAIAFYAIVSLGAVVTPVGQLRNIADLTYLLRDCGARVLIAPALGSDAIHRAAEKVGIPQTIAFEEVNEALLHPFPSDDGEIPAIDAREHAAALVYSNGSSDVLMGVRLTHYNIVANVVQAQAVNPIDKDEVLIGITPFCQMYSMVPVNLALHAGATLVTLPQFTLPYLLCAVDRYKVTTAYLDPVIIGTLAKHAPINGYDLSSLRHVVSMTIPLSQTIAKLCADRFGCSLQQAYGLTEAVAFTHFTPRHQTKVTSVGIAVPNTEFRIVDVVSMTDVEPGKLGEVCVRGPQVMKSYHNYPEVSDRVLDENGWLHTGDIGYADKDGYLSVVDRSKRLARLRGLYFADKELLRISVEDIATRRRRADTLAFQARLLDSVRESVISTDPQNRVTFWNKGAEHLFGYSADEALGKPITSLIILPGQHLTQPDKTIALRTRGTWNSRITRRRKDGSLLWTDVIVSTVRNGDNELSGFIGLHRDITEQKQIEERLRFQAQLLDSVQESVVATDLTSRIVFWGRGAEALFGHSSTEVLGQPLFDMTLPHASEPIMDFCRVRDEVLERGIWSAVSTRCIRRGSDFWADITVAPVRKQDGQPVGLIAIHRDVTELRRNQELLKDSHERLRNLTARLLVVGEQERSSLARELHDELGQVLTRLNMDLNWLTQRLPVRLRTKRSLSMGALVDRMLKTVQHLSSELRPLIIDDLGLEAAIECHAQEFEEWSGCRCNLDLRIGMLATDRDRDIAAFRILQETLTNVARHARASEVTVRGWTSDGEFVLEVEDNGVGISADKVASLHSLGIIGMRERAESLGGQLLISSAENVGTRVTLKLKVTEPSVLGGVLS